MVAQKHTQGQRRVEGTKPVAGASPMDFEGTPDILSPARCTGAVSECLLKHI